MSARTPSESITFRWSFSSAVRWPTMSTNLLLDPLAKQAVKEKNLDWLGLLEAEPDAGLGNGGTRAAGRLLPRLDGHDATPSDGLRPALRIRHLSPDDPGWLAARTARQLAPPFGPLGGRSPARDCGSQVGLLVRDARWRPATHPRKDRHAVWHPLRPPRGRLRRQDDQHASALGRRSPGFFRFSEIQRRRFRRRAGRDAHGRVAHAGTVSR